MQNFKIKCKTREIKNLLNNTMPCVQQFESLQQYSPLTELHSKLFPASVPLNLSHFSIGLRQQNV